MALTKLATLAAAAFSLLLFLNPSTTAAAGGGANSLVTQTCKQTPNYDLCVSTITADPRAATAADVDTLALVMLDAVRTKATAAEGRIKQLMKAARSSAMRKHEPLDNCAARYDVVLEADVTVARQAVKLGNPKFGEGAMNDVGVECEDCEGGFGRNGEKSPLTKQNGDVRGLADVAAAIVRLLL
ncbi:unnamed protein product [Linum tenue]|uniref:Pectinesterase inhibitor domain-containing protein n=1 Tax=Linum tenue TaxID=586396 RepID=A0AAV0P8M4_9ROSI|nr:unnamed protein product [Linum tenue]